MHSLLVGWSSGEPYCQVRLQEMFDSAAAKTKQYIVTLLHSKIILPFFQFKGTVFDLFFNKFNLTPYLATPSIINFCMSISNMLLSKLVSMQKNIWQFVASATPTLSFR